MKDIEKVKSLQEKKEKLFSLYNFKRIAIMRISVFIFSLLVKKIIMAKTLISNMFDIL